MPDPHRILRLLLPLAVLAAAPGVSAQINVLQKELFAREISLFLGAEPDPPRRQLVTRELSLFLGAEPDPPFRETFARETSILLPTTPAPSRITTLHLDFNPTGSTTTLDWTTYNEFAEHDVAHYHIYQSDQPFTDIASMTPVATTAAETRTLTFTGLPPWNDRYFAVVAIDSTGAFDPVVEYRAAIALQPELVTRELSLFLGAEPDPPTRSLTSRAITIALTTPSPPAPVTSLDVSVPPTANAATLDWTGYNEWAQHDVVRYDIYLETRPFLDITTLTPARSLPANSFSTTFDNLAPWTDRYFAVVAVDALGNATPAVQYRAGIALQPEILTREISLFLGAEHPAGPRQSIAREFSLLLSDPPAPAPVTYPGSPFSAETSTTTYAAIELDWSSYNEWAEHDVTAYRIYTGTQFFDDISTAVPYATLPAETRRHTLQGLDGNTVYYIAIVAEDALGQRHPTVHAVSAISSVSTVGDIENLSLTNCGPDTLTFSWSPRPGVTDFLDHYQVYFAGAPAPAVLSPDTTTFTATGLDPATSYPVRVTTVDRFATESGGRSTRGVTYLPNPAPVVACASDRTVQLTWPQATPASLVQHYAVYHSTSPITSVAGQVPVLTTTDATATVTGLTNNTPYHFAVATVNLSACSDPAVHSILATPHDGFERWAATYGLTGIDALPTADPNRNGIDNYLSYAFQIPPTGETTAEMRSWLPRAFIQGDSFTIELYLPLPLPSGVTYEAIARPDLRFPATTLARRHTSSPTWQSLQATIVTQTPTANRTRVRIESPNKIPPTPHQFENIRVSPSPTP